MELGMGGLGFMKARGVFGGSIFGATLRHASTNAESSVDTAGASVEKAAVHRRSLPPAEAARLRMRCIFQIREKWREMRWDEIWGGEREERPSDHWRYSQIFANIFSVFRMDPKLFYICTCNPTVHNFHIFGLTVLFYLHAAKESRVKMIKDIIIALY